ncbi:MAG TPA: aspartyl protease family protein [Candidatus Bathyarchaeia archaeon]|nr:aspartyl protease family protein [Candidatus Bathyarchaeia archaeon]
MTDKTSGIDPIFIATFQFQIGQFTESEKSFHEILKEDPKNFQALVLLGNLALMKNNFTKAEQYLLKASEIAPQEPAPHALLAETYYRQDKYQKASLHLRFYGINDMAERLESFQDIQPYQIVSDSDSYKIKILQVDPLPIIQVKINDLQPVNFLIDTGAAELMIDLDFAKENNLEIFGSKEGTFAGGMKAPINLGKIDSFTLGNLKVNNIPANFLPIRPISQIFGGLRIDGIIGTAFFYHFITTLDYPQGELIFRKNTFDQLNKFENQIKNLDSIEIPFWLAEDHFMVAWGQVNDADLTLFFLDTGLAGGGFTGSKVTLDNASVVLDESKSFEGIGGGGKVKAIPFVIDKLAFGDAVERNINGVFAGSFPLEEKLGFKVGGIISHQFFRNYALTFDFIKMRFILIKKEEVNDQTQK